MKILKSKHSIVAYGEDGLDEISLSGGTHIWELKNGIITERSIKPSDLGLPFVDNAEIKINNPNESAKILEKVYLDKKLQLDSWCLLMQELH
ncbi:MAG: hypothetical protein CM1200mP8_5380 [Chloroflexota bacterium]|nr:MAG: hypothetical protein CM1200mP8_5380 [Chloroflexota bacterium]